MAVAKHNCALGATLLLDPHFNVFAQSTATFGASATQTRLRVAIVLVCGSSVCAFLGAYTTHAQAPLGCEQQDELLTPSAWCIAVAQTRPPTDTSELLTPPAWRAPRAQCGSLLDPGVICAADPELVTPSAWAAPARRP